MCRSKLEYGNLKLGNELSDVFALSGQLMLKALVDEKLTPEEIADLTQGSLKKEETGDRRGGQGAAVE